MHNAVPLTI